MCGPRSWARVCAWHWEGPRKHLLGECLGNVCEAGLGTESELFQILCHGSEVQEGFIRDQVFLGVWGRGTHRSCCSLWKWCLDTRECLAFDPITRRDMSSQG